MENCHVQLRDKWQSVAHKKNDIVLLCSFKNNNSDNNTVKLYENIIVYHAYSTVQFFFAQFLFKEVGNWLSSLAYLLVQGGLEDWFK